MMLKVYFYPGIGTNVTFWRHFAFLEIVAIRIFIN